LFLQGLFYFWVSVFDSVDKLPQKIKKKGVYDFGQGLALKKKLVIIAYRWAKGIRGLTGASFMKFQFHINLNCLSTSAVS